MRLMVYGDSNVDVTVSWGDAVEYLNKLSSQNRGLIADNIKKAEILGSDLEYYLEKKDDELSEFFNSLEHKTEFGGCAAIKAMIMARLGHEVSLYSWVGDDANGRMILKVLREAGVDTSNIVISAKTCETFNLFDKKRPRLAFSYWEDKQDFSEFRADVDKKRPDAVFLAGAHRTRSSLGYASLEGCYVFSGSFVMYSKDELIKKHASDLSSGILVGNDSEILQLASAFSSEKRQGPDLEKSRKAILSDALVKIPNDLIVMHGPDLTAVKRDGRVIYEKTSDIPESKMVERTGIGDVWESFFIDAVRDLGAATESKITAAMSRASKASRARMVSGKFPTII